MQSQSLEYYKKQAVKFKKNFNGSEQHLKRIKAFISDFNSPKLSLTQAQFIIARENGFPNWAAFKKQIELSNLDGVRFIFHGRLKNFLPRSMRRKAIDMKWESHRTVKDWIESLCIPHTEVGEILLGGKKIDLNSKVENGSVLQIYEINGPYDPRKKSWFNEPLLKDVRFIADVHLGKLVRYLRMLGLDCMYEEPWDDDILAAKAAEENRIMLSRDMGLLQRKCVSHGQFLHSDDPVKQASEVLKRYRIYDLCKPLSRCVSCNSIMKPVAKNKVLDKIPEGTQKYYDKFFQCTACKKVYWHGAHVKNIVKTLKEITGQTEANY